VGGDPIAGYRNRIAAGMTVYGSFVENEVSLAGRICQFLEPAPRATELSRRAPTD
jgi:hypothetical protein